MPVNAHIRLIQEVSFFLGVFLFLCERDKGEGTGVGAERCLRGEGINESKNYHTEKMKNETSKQTTSAKNKNNNN